MNINPDHRRVFELLNVAAAGEPIGTTLPAVIDLLCAIISIGADSQAEALKVARAAGSDLIATVTKNYEHYHAQAAEHPNAPAGRA